MNTPKYSIEETQKVVPVRILLANTAEMNV